MNIPLQIEEISALLDVSYRDIEELWSSGSLRKSVACHHRPTGAITHSSPFDLLEFGLSSGAFGLRLDSQDAEQWIQLLAELVEESSFDPADAVDQIQMMTAEAYSFWRHEEIKTANCISSLLIKKYHAIFSLISKTDRTISTQTG